MSILSDKSNALHQPICLLDYLFLKYKYQCGKMSHPAIYPGFHNRDGLPGNRMACHFLAVAKELAS